MTKKDWCKPELRRIEAGSAGGQKGKLKIVDKSASKS
jgi:hypothetical protein